LATLHQRGLTLVDINFNRVRSAAYLEARRRRALPDLPVEGAGRPATVNVLFCRQSPAGLNIDRLLKLIAIYELHGLNDIATATRSLQNWGSALMWSALSICYAPARRTPTPSGWLGDLKFT
jgi:hypothetical protein